ncbi:MAG: hypothetical protein IKJ27_02270 [Clostridia bacterium]|nr:hypothetical protein [Clostridia bacterium]
MTGLDKITEKILTDSHKCCEKVLEDGAQQVRDIITEAKAEGERQFTQIIKEAEKKAEKKIAAAKSNAESITRNRYLEIRNAILNDVISASYEKIEKLSDDDYFELIKKLCYKNIQAGECVMYMNGSDLFRMPASFEDDINSAVFEKGAVHISKDAVDIENGFILKYDGFEVNCTLKAIFDECMDDLKFTVSKALFN